MTSSNEKRIGRRSESGKTVWPMRSISGAEYSRPCNQVGLGDGFFCVVEPFPIPGHLAEIEKLKKVVKGMGAPPKIKRKVADES